VTEVEVKAAGLEVLVTAVGSKPIVRWIPETERENVIDVVTALLFRCKRNNVTLIEKSERLVLEDPMAYNAMVLERLLDAEGVQVFIEAQVAAVAD